MKRFLMLFAFLMAFASAHAQVSTTYIDFPKARRVCQETLQTAVEQVGREIVRTSENTRFGRSNTFFGQNSNEPAYRLTSSSSDGIVLNMELQVSVRYIPPVAVYFPEAYEVSHQGSINGRELSEAGIYQYQQWHESNMANFEKGLQALLRDAPDCNAGSGSSATSNNATSSSASSSARIPFVVAPKITFPADTWTGDSSNTTCQKILALIWGSEPSLLRNDERFTRQGGCYYFKIAFADVLKSMNDLLPQQGLAISKTLTNDNGSFQTWYAPNSNKGTLLWYASIPDSAYKTGLMWFEVQRAPAAAAATASPVVPNPSLFAFEPRLALPTGAQSYPSASCQAFIDELTTLYVPRAGDSLVSSGCYALPMPVAKASEVLSAALQNLGWQNYWRGQSGAGYSELGFFDGFNPAMILQFVPATDPNYSFVVWVRFEHP